MARRQKSIQATKKRGQKSSSAKLQEATLKKAHRQGLPWDSHEVKILVKGIENDLTTYELAISLGRSYYGTMSARAHVRFALNHANAILGARGKK